MTKLHLKFPGPLRVSADGKDDRYVRGRCLRRQRWLGAGGYDHCYAAANEVGCERRQPIHLVLRIPVLDRHVPDIAGFLQALDKRKNGAVSAGSLRVLISGAENTNHRHRRLLRPRHHRPRRRAPEPSDEVPSPHP
jgi:hypothetical protein